MVWASPKVLIAIAAIIGLVLGGVPGLAIGGIAGFLLSLAVGLLVRATQGGVVPRKQKDRLATSFVRNHQDLVAKKFGSVPLRSVLGRLDDMIEEFARRAVQLSPTHEAIFRQDVMAAAMRDVISEKADPVDQQFYAALAAQLGHDWYHAPEPGGTVDLSSADGTRWSMKTSYARHAQGLPHQWQSPGVGEHEAGLFGALASRYAAGGMPDKVIEQTASAIWLELLPFLHLPGDVAADALAEYVVWKEPETRRDAKSEWLRQQLLDGLDRARRAGRTDVVERMLATPRDKWALFPWLELVRK